MTKCPNKLFGTESTEDHSYEVESIIKKYFHHNENLAAIEAGHTYLGQMIAHDIVPSTTLHLNRKKISSSLNLDSLYGDKNNPAFFDKDGQFILGAAKSPNGKMIDGKDLLRGKNHKALIPEDRNDENIIISQMHLFFQKFHNLILNEVKSFAGGENIFECTKYIITKVFHEITVFDFMKQVIHPQIYEIYTPVNKNSFNYSRYDILLGVPSEFSHAVFRFGHSMVRREYNLNNNSRIKIADNLSNRSLQLKTENIIDWGLFFTTKRISDSLFLKEKSTEKSIDVVEIVKDAVSYERTDNFKITKSVTSFAVQHSMQIDTSIVDGLNKIPFICQKPEDIKRINLKAGLVYNINFGSEIKDKLRKIAIFNKLFKDKADEIDQLEMMKLPLWPYILMEAQIAANENQSAGLGLVGSIIVAEVISKAIKSVEYNHKYHTQFNQIINNIKNYQLQLEKPRVPRRSLASLNKCFLEKPISMGYCINYLNKKR